MNFRVKLLLRQADSLKRFSLAQPRLTIGGSRTASVPIDGWPAPVDPLEVVPCPSGLRIERRPPIGVGLPPAGEIWEVKQSIELPTDPPATLTLEELTEVARLDWAVMEGPPFSRRVSLSSEAVDAAGHLDVLPWIETQIPQIEALSGHDFTWSLLGSHGQEPIESNPQVLRNGHASLAPGRIGLWPDAAWTGLLEGNLVLSRSESMTRLWWPVLDEDGTIVLLLGLDAAPEDEVAWAQRVWPVLQGWAPILSLYGKAWSARANAAQALAENRHHRARQRARFREKALVFRSPPMQRMRRQLPELSASDAPVLLEGEAGTGKELVARAIHHRSDRQEHMMAALRCSRSDEDLLDRQLFGATTPLEEPGLLELVGGGTLFVDGVEVLGLDLQLKLERAIVEGEIFRLGDEVARPISARVIASTSEDLNTLASAGRFRQRLADLLTSHVLRIPPLRERREDIVPLAHEFVRMFADHYDRSLETLDPEVEQMLLRAPWPGNVRELQMAIERAVLHTSPRMTALPLSSFALHPS